MRKSVASVAVVWAVLVAQTSQGGTDTAASGKAPLRWRMEHLCRIVKPMQHKLAGRLPLLVWNYPVPWDDKAVAWRKDGRLRKAIDDLWARGIALPAEIGTWGTADGAMAIARTVKEAGLPVHVLYGFGIVGCKKGAPYKGSPTVKGPWPWDKKGKVTWKGTRSWPVFPLYDVSESVAFYRQWMKRFKEAGIEVVGVWADYEGLPNAYNFAYQGQKVAEARKHYPPGVLDSEEAFHQYVGELRNRVLSEAIADPVHETFPKALVGNYGASESSEAYPFVGLHGNACPPRTITIGRMNVLMPTTYAWGAATLPHYYNEDWPITRSDVDNIFFISLLRTLSSSLANKKPGQVAIPYIARFIAVKSKPRYLYDMSIGLYRELHRHALLRGTDSFYVYNEGYQDNPKGLISPQYSFETVEASRVVYDEMLAHREFLDRGKPMSFDVPAMRMRGAVWSGLRLGDTCLVRAFTLGAKTRRVDLIAFPGQVVTIDAPPQGATYLVDKRGTVRKVRTGL